MKRKRGKDEGRKGKRARDGCWCGLLYAAGTIHSGTRTATANTSHTPSELSLTSSHPKTTCPPSVPVSPHTDYASRTETPLSTSRHPHNSGTPHRPTSRRVQFMVQYHHHQAGTAPRRGVTTRWSCAARCCSAGHVPIRCNGFGLPLPHASQNDTRTHVNDTWHTAFPLPTHGTDTGACGYNSARLLDASKAWMGLPLSPRSHQALTL